MILINEAFREFAYRLSDTLSLNDALLVTKQTCEIKHLHLKIKQIVLFLTNELFII